MTANEPSRWAHPVLRALWPSRSELALPTPLWGAWNLMLPALAWAVFASYAGWRLGSMLCLAVIFTGAVAGSVLETGPKWRRIVAAVGALPVVLFAAVVTVALVEGMLEIPAVPLETVVELAFVAGLLWSAGWALSVATFRGGLEKWSMG